MQPREACTSVIWEGSRGPQEGPKTVVRKKNHAFLPLIPLKYSALRPAGSAMTLVSIPANPVPEGAVSGTITTPDGAELRFARWAPPAGRKGTVCVFAGRGEYIEKYFETVRDLRD